MSTSYYLGQRFSQLLNSACLMVVTWMPTHSVPSKKVLHWANVCFVAHEAHGVAQPCRHTNSKRSQR